MACGVDTTAKATLLGAPGLGEGVVIGRIDDTGLAVDTPTLITDNHIGVGRNGTSALLNADDGIVLHDTPQAGVDDSIVA